MCNRVFSARLSGILDLHLPVNAHPEINRAYHHKHQRGPDNRKFNRHRAYYAPIRSG